MIEVLKQEIGLQKSLVFLQFGSLSLQVRFDEIESRGHRVLRAHTIVISLEVGNIFDLATVCFKISFCVAHWD